MNRQFAESLRETEGPLLAKILTESIANLGYPVGCGIPPNEPAVRQAAEKLFARFVAIAAAIDSVSTESRSTLTYPCGSLGEEVHP